MKKYETWYHPKQKEIHPATTLLKGFIFGMIGLYGLAYFLSTVAIHAN